ncbi:Endoribonuclease ysh-1 [Microthyrium microscopicum]|uniref:Endoribonuclease ysh-1 n=1 Tax=Microthyrium microscopicum TaxID=703497 RepID=A0A6A6UMT2_9PEZI|nr:Endoribonuclease ysh-1 [Microthyrium microscopicum]
MSTKRKADDLDGTATESANASDTLQFTCLGGGNEVGRSCHIIEYKGKTVMLDAGMHPGYDGSRSLPWFDSFDLGKVDLLLISHFHVDHAAALPYVLAKTNFQGRVLMTYATKAIYRWLIPDGLRVNNLTSSAEQKIALYTEADHLATFPKIEPIDFYTTHTISSIRVTPYPAGHVLGAAMYLIDIAGLKILFTGDYSREEDRHLVKATIPEGLKVDVLICESTFGTALHIPRAERELAFLKGVTGILDRNGRALLPVFALGTVQELLLILEEYWSKHPQYQKVPIYYASQLARRCMVVYKTYISAMNENIKRLFAERMADAERSGKDPESVNPWNFQFVRALKSIDRFEDTGPCVMLATPGMMQNGASRQLLERWAPDPKNGVIITGYSVEGTMAQTLLNEPQSVKAIMNQPEVQVGRVAEERHIARRCTIQETSFAAHVDGPQNREFVEETGAEIIILVHGAKHAMTRFKSKLLSLNSTRAKPFKVFTPANSEVVKIPFKRDKFAKVVGRLAKLPPPTLLSAPQSDAAAQAVEDDRIVSGVLVQNGFNLTLMAPEDLKEYAGLTTTSIAFKKRLFCSAGVDLIKWGLEGMFGGLKEIPTSSSNGNVNGNGTNGHTTQSSTTFLVMDSVTVNVETGGQVTLEWEGNMLNDSIADSVLSVLLQMETGMVGVKRSASPHAHHHDEHNPHTTRDPADKLARLLLLLENQFGDSAITPIIATPAGDDSASASTWASLTSSTADKDEPGLEIRIAPFVARVWLRELRVECSNGALRARVQAVVERACETVASMG